MRKYGNFTRKEAISLIKYQFGLTTKQAEKYLADCNGNYRVLNFIEEGIKQDAHSTFYECNKE